MKTITDPNFALIIKHVYSLLIPTTHQNLFAKPNYISLRATLIVQWIRQMVFLTIAVKDMPGCPGNTHIYEEYLSSK